MRATFIQGVIATAALCVLAPRSSAIEDLKIQVQGGDVVLHWPSTAGQQFTVQRRELFETGTKWVTLTNGLLSAVNTNRTMFVHLGALSVGGGASMPLQSTQSGTEALTANKESDAHSEQRKAQRTDAVAWLMAQTEAAFAKAKQFQSGKRRQPQGEARMVQSQASGSSASSSPVSAGFYRVLHTPTWTINPANYSFDGPIFIPVDFGGYEDRVHNTEVLLDGQPAEEAAMIPFVSGGVTNWGMGIYFDLVANGTHTIQLLSTVLLNDSVGDDSAYVTVSNRSSPFWSITK